MEKVKRTPASLKKMVETFGMEILHRGSDYDSAVITISDVNRPAPAAGRLFTIILTTSACKYWGGARYAIWSA